MDGQVYCWGDNSYGQVGNGMDDMNFASPQLVMREDGTNPLTGVVSLGCGRKFACALDERGKAWCWGDNGVGQLGRGDSGESSNLAVGVQGDLSFEHMVVGTGVACGLSGETLYCWGDNSMGAFGQSSPNQSSVPIQVTTPSAP